MIRTGWWAIRVFDFPRLQFGMVGLILLPAVLLALPTGEAWVWCILLGCATLWQFAHIIRFTRVWPSEVAGCANGDQRLVTANLDVRNEQKPGAVEKLRSLDADHLLLIEVDQQWFGALADLRETYPYRIEHVADEGLGMVLWSRARGLEDGHVRFLVSDARVSIEASLRDSVGHTVRIRGLHPTPPALPKEHGADDSSSSPEGRHNSRIRDAELVLVAREVAKDPGGTWIVTGDFNDVAWSRTTRLFKQISGLLDPRVGRGLLNTYHARHPLLRYPLDHVLISPNVSVAAIERIRIPGSDHFGITMDFTVGTPSDSSHRSDAKAVAGGGVPDRIVGEGERDAAQNES